MTRQRVSGLRHQNGAGRRGCQEPRGCVHGVAGHRVSGTGGGPEAAGDDRTAVDADVKHDPLAQTRCPLLAERRGALEHVERRLERALRVVLVSGRRAEDRHHRVADEFLDEAAIARDRLRQGLEQRVLERADLFGIEPLRQRGESGEVGEEHGDLPPVGFPRVGLRGRSWARGAGG